MILQLLSLTTVLLLQPAWSALLPDEFKRNIQPTCFKEEGDDGAVLVNGQEKPLASTLENFIALVEKLEVANPNILLKDELFYFLRSYFYENTEFLASNGITTWEPRDVKYAKIENMWEPNNEERKKKLDAIEDPFTEDEKCSLFFMISHSIVRTARSEARFFSSRNSSDFQRAATELNKLYPQEQGVVAIRGSREAVALGRILRGMYVGLKSQRERQINIENYPDIAEIPPEVLPEKRDVDPLYILTMAEVLSVSTWGVDKRCRDMAVNGAWKSVPIGTLADTEDACPMIYKLPNETMAAYSYSTLRGAADGLILGSVVNSIFNMKGDVKLSQILRMYYTRGGIMAEIQDVGSVRASFCNRNILTAALDEEIQAQVHLFGLLVAKAPSEVNDKTANALREYNRIKSIVFDQRGEFQDLKQYCSFETPKELPLETSLDVIVVLDTRNGEENFEKQQRIVAFLGKKLDLRYFGSRLTILKDQRSMSSTGASGRVELIPVLTDSYSPGCAACLITQITLDNSPSAPTDEVIFAIDQLLEAKKENETKSEGAKGKVVVYFNFDADERSARPGTSETKLKKALADLHLRHQDVPIFALGIDEGVLKKFARLDKNFYMLADTTEENKHLLLKKITSVPAILKYEDCKDRKNEPSATYEDFVSPSAVKHWQMPAKYFYKSTSLKVVFESTEGNIQVCHSRATLFPELEINSCKNLTNGKNVEFKSTNPCKSFTEKTCSPFYFSLIGINSTDPTVSKSYCSDRQTEAKCKTLDQIKFKVSHDGIRCSGCYGLMAKPLSILLGFLISYILIKKF